MDFIIIVYLIFGLGFGVGAVEPTQEWYERFWTLLMFTIFWPLFLGFIISNKIK